MIGLRVWVAVVAFAAACCPSKAKPDVPEPPVTVDAGADAGVDSAVVAPEAAPSIAWQADGTIVVDQRWALSPDTWLWKPIDGGPDAKTPNLRFPDAPPAGAAAAVPDPGGKWRAWAEPGRVCFVVADVAGYVCAMLPSSP